MHPHTITSNFFGTSVSLLYNNNDAQRKALRKGVHQLIITYQHMTHRFSHVQSSRPQNGVTDGALSVLDLMSNVGTLYHIERKNSGEVAK